MTMDVDHVGVESHRITLRYAVLRYDGPMTEPATLAETLRGLREQAGLSQTGLAAKASLSVGYINDLERGRRLRPSPPVKARLARALRCHIGRLAP